MKHLIENIRPAVAYLRRSTDKQEQSLSSQRREIERWARENGYRVIEWYVDDAVSGTGTKNRESYNRLRKDIQKSPRPFEAILIYDLSRLSRENPFEAISQINEIRKRGIELISVTEPLPGNDMDCLILLIQQMQNHGESKDTSRKTITGQITTAKQGFWSGGTPPWGFDLEYVDRTGKPIARVRYLESGDRALLTPDGEHQRIFTKKERYRKSDADKARLVLSKPDRVAIIQRIFTLYTVDGLGCKGIADRFNREKIPSPRSGNYSRKAKAGWASSTIREMLRNRAYLGDSVWNQRTSAKFYRVSDERAEAREEHSYEKLENNLEQDLIIKENAHPAIIDRETFQKAQAIAKARQKKSGGGRPRTGRAARSRYLLSGKIRCANCGHNFSGQPQNRGKPRKDGTPIKTFYYMCSGYLNKGRSICTCFRIPMAEIESIVLEKIKELVASFIEQGGDEVVRRIVESTTKSENGNQQKEQELAARLDAIQVEIERLIDCITPDTKDDIGRRIGKRNHERAGIEREQESLEQKKKQQVDADQIARDILDQIKEFTKVFEEGTIEEKKSFVGLFVDGIDVDPETRTIKLHIRKFPAPRDLDTGNASFQMVAGTGFEPATFGL